MKHIQQLEKQQIPQALDLAWEVFEKYVGIDYTQRGIDEFYQFLHTPSLTKPLVYYGAFDKNQMIGMIAMRNNHIALFFVKDTWYWQSFIYVYVNADSRSQDQCKFIPICNRNLS